MPALHPSDRLKVGDAATLQPSQVGYIWWGVASLALVLALRLASCAAAGLRACCAACQNGCIACDACCPCCFDACWTGAACTRVAPGGLDTGERSDTEDRLGCTSSLFDLKCSGMEGGGQAGRSHANAAFGSSMKSSRTGAPAAQAMIAALRLPGGRAAAQPE